MSLPVPTTDLTAPEYEPPPPVPVKWGWAELVFILAAAALITSWVVGFDHTL